MKDNNSASQIIENRPNTKIIGLIVRGIHYIKSCSHFTDNNVVAVASILVLSHYFIVYVTFNYR
jgi:hypothetical protein